MIDTAKLYQHYEKLPRPTLRWVSLGGAAWAFGLCDVFGYPMESATRGVILGFVALVYGIRGVEKLKGQGDD